VAFPGRAYRPVIPAGAGVAAKAGKVRVVIMKRMRWREILMALGFNLAGLGAMVLW
jgi:hypothetical protein